MQTKLLITSIVIAIIIVGIIAYTYTKQSQKYETLIIFHAGSLTGAVEDYASILMEEYKIKVLNEPSGSVDAIRKVVDLHKPADVIMSADYRLIPSLMFDGGYANWCLIFASNEMVIAYTNKSLYAEEINNENWLEIILRENVRIGFSDPNRDPCGYRSLMVLALASKKYENYKPLKVLEEHAEIRFNINETGIFIDATGVNPDSAKIFVREKSVDLISLLEAGVIDYAFEYRNVAVSKHLMFVELPEEVNLANPSLDGWYSKVSVKIYGSGGKIRILSAASIAYGLTISENAPHPDLARKFVEFLLSDKGVQVLVDNGFKPLKPTIIGEAPSWLENIVAEVS